MARIISDTEQTQNIIISNRSWRVEIFCEKNSPYDIFFHREKVMQINNGPKILVENLPTISKGLNNVVTQEVTVNGLTLTIAQIAAFVAAVGDAWEEEIEAQQE
jgi:hypothetical protein